MRYFYLLARVAACCIPSSMAAQTVTLYSNSFTTPNMAVNTAACGTDISQQSVNDLWAGTGGGTGGGGQWAQTFTVETLLIDGPGNVYTDSSGAGGDYCLGMQTAQQNDMAALTLDSDGLPFVNLTMDIAAIEVSGCGAPFGVAPPVLQVSLYDTPTGVFNINSPGTLLDQVTLTGGSPASDPFSFAWSSVGAGLNVSASTNGVVTVMLDLQASGYAAFDNLLIMADSSALGIAHESPQNGVPVWVDAVNARIGVTSAEPNAAWMIHDRTGRLVAKGMIGLAQGLDIRTLISGTYILSWTDTHGGGNSRFVVP